MKNSIVKFDRTDIYEGYSVTDYTSKHLEKIYELDEISDPNYVRYYQLLDNETIEQVSYKVYGTPMYWDVILFVNRVDPLFDMVYDFDFSRNTAEDFIDHYNEVVFTGGNMEPAQSLPTTYLDLLKDVKTEEYETLKEAKRTIKVIRHDKILDFMKILRQSEII